VSGNGKALISKDGLRQYRFPSPKPGNPRSSTGHQSNFESRSKPDGPWENNGHLDVQDIILADTEKIKGIVNDGLVVKSADS